MEEGSTWSSGYLHGSAAKRGRKSWGGTQTQGPQTLWLLLLHVWSTPEFALFTLLSYIGKTKWWIRSFSTLSQTIIKIMRIFLFFSLFLVCVKLLSPIKLYLQSTSFHVNVSFFIFISISCFVIFISTFMVF